MEEIKQKQMYLLTDLYCVWKNKNKNMIQLDRKSTKIRQEKGQDAFLAFADSFSPMCDVYVF